MKKALLIILVQVVFMPVSHALTTACNYNSPGYIINRFTDNSDGTVLDNVTGLTWQRCVLGRPWHTEAEVCNTASGTILNDWKTTLETVADFNNTEFSNGRAYDWRLPNIKEIASIINLNCIYPAIDSSVFLIAEISHLWSSTPSTTVWANVLHNTGTTYTYENHIWSMNVIEGMEKQDPWSTKKAALLVRGTSGN